MNWEEAKSQSKAFWGSLMLTWPQLTEDDLRLLEGEKSAFLERLRQRVGGELTDLERQFDDLLSSVDLDRKHSGVIHLTAG